MTKQSFGGITAYSGSFDQTGTYLGAGQYTITGPGGADVGAFTAQLNVPQPLVWTNQASILTVNRASGVTVNWSGGDPAGYVQISGSSFVVTTGTTGVGAIFTCTARTSDLAFTVPAIVLLSLPAGGSTGGISIPTGSLSVSGNSATSQFTASGIEFGSASASVSNQNTVTYQ